MKGFFKRFLVITALSIFCCINVYATEKESMPVEEVTTLDSVDVERAVPGISLSVAEANFFYNTQVTLTVPAGKTGNAVGFLVYDTDRTLSSSNKVRITPTITNSNIPANGKWHYFNINPLSSGRSITYTITLAEGDMTKQYHVVAILYQKV